MAAINILMIEDDEGDAMLTRMALEEQGYSTSVTIISTAKEALHFLQSAPLNADGKAAIDLILLDGSLNDASGLEVILAVQAISVAAQIPIVILTGSSSPMLQQAFRENGAVCVIEKSGDFDTLVERLANLTTYCPDGTLCESLA